MSRLVVLSFPDRAKADQAVVVLKKLHAGGAIKFQASALAVKDGAGKLSVQEITKEGHGGTRAGALIGALAGLPAGPAASVIMATGGAVIGNAADLTNEQDFNDFAEGIVEDMAPGGAVIVAEVADDSVSAFDDEMAAIGGSVVFPR